MGAKTRSASSSDREKWGQIFDRLMKLIKNLVKERKLLEDRIKMQLERWSSDIRLYESQIIQMKNHLTEKEMDCLVEAAKSELMTGLKQREASLHKLKLEKAEDELVDLRAWFDFLPHSLNGSSKDTELPGLKSIDLKSARSKTLKEEVKRLQLEYEKLSSEKNHEISSLLNEKKFVWNQYNVLESNLTNKLRSKETEVERANEKIVELVANLESLQSSISEKDTTIERLTTKVTEMEADRNKSKEEISNLSQELESLKKSRCSETPVLKACNAEAKTYRLTVKSSGKGGKDDTVKIEFPSTILATFPMKNVEKGSRRSFKRKSADAIDIQETPKLFDSSFKIPKLKLLSTVR